VLLLLLLLHPTITMQKALSQSMDAVVRWGRLIGWRFHTNQPVEPRHPSPCAQTKNQQVYARAADQRLRIEICINDLSPFPSQET